MVINRNVGWPNLDLGGALTKSGGRKRFFSPQTFAMAVANVYRNGCKRLREKRQCTAFSTQVRASEIEPKNIHTWQKVPHEHVVRDLPDSLSHGINPRCLLNHHLGLRRADWALGNVLDSLTAFGPFHSLNHHLDCVEVILARKCTRQPNGFRSISLT